VLHRIAFPVVSEWYQRARGYRVFLVLRTGTLSSPGPLHRQRSSVESYWLERPLLGELELRQVLGAVLEPHN
jgi:hypothetical protein